MYFIDSNICIYFLNGRFPSVKERLLSISPKEIKISAIVKGELLLGAFKSRTRAQSVSRVENFLNRFDIVDFTSKMTYEYAEIRKDLEQKSVRMICSLLQRLCMKMQRWLRITSMNSRE